MINEKYSSFVFIGEIITDEILNCDVQEIEYCINCGACDLSCPVNMEISKCLSSITQKKGELTNNEIEIIKKHGCAWGCDICQNACPYTKLAIKSKSIYTNVEFFKKERTPHLTSTMIENIGYSPWSHKKSDMTEQLSTHSTYLILLAVLGIQ